MYALQFASMAYAPWVSTSTPETCCVRPLQPSHLEDDLLSEVASQRDSRHCNDPGAVGESSIARRRGKPSLIPDVELGEAMLSVVS